MRKTNCVCLSFFVLSLLITVTNPVTWGPTVGDFRITHFEDFGEVENQIEHSITITCIEGGGSSIIEFKTNLPIHITSRYAIKSLQKGESYTDTFIIDNPFGHPEVEGYINATISNTLGTITDTKTAYGSLAFNDYPPEETQLEITETDTEPPISTTAIILVASMITIGILVGVIIEKTRSKKTSLK